MDKYNSRIAKFVKWITQDKSSGYAITLGQTAYYPCNENEVSDKWHAHEDCHKTQWARDGKLKFLARYLWQTITKGYEKIDYEIEARTASKNT